MMFNFFPKNHAAHTSYGVHDLSKEWPAEMHGKYDFVHQRLALLGAGKETTPKKAVAYLGALVAPGGWIQLGELDVRKPASGGRAMEDAMTVIRGVFDTACSTNDFAYNMADYLREAGFEDARLQTYECLVGPRCKDPVMSQNSIDVMLESWEALLGAAKRECMHLFAPKCAWLNG